MPCTMLLLASHSLARQSLLTSAGISYDVVTSQVDEEKAKQSFRNTSPQELALHLARAKAEGVKSVRGVPFVIAADQTLELDGKLLHKAKDLTTARLQLLQLRGKSHYLHSAFAVRQANDFAFEHVSTAAMTMRNFSDAFLEDYLARAGTALTSSVGCYHYEGLGIQLFEKVEGDISTIMGLPLLPLLDFLRKVGEVKQ
jgi:septum formation protein